MGFPSTLCQVNENQPSQWVFFKKTGKGKGQPGLEISPMNVPCLGAGRISGTGILGRRREPLRWALRITVPPSCFLVCQSVRARQTRRRTITDRQQPPCLPGQARLFLTHSKPNCFRQVFGRSPGPESKPPCYPTKHYLWATNLLTPKEVQQKPWRMLGQSHTKFAFLYSPGPLA